MSTSEDVDKKRILDHIHSIFQAFIDQDRKTLKATHASDWIGFLGPSDSIERGLDAYMANAEKSLRSFQGTGYELLDHEIQLYGDIAFVFYVARFEYKDQDDTEHSLPLRSIDIYRRESAGWIQAGSHISVIPSTGSWGEGDQ